MARSDIVFGSTKTYRALTSTAFRQPLADSHCNKNHGYGLNWMAQFEATQLDHRNWVVDFGELKTFKGWLEKQFDHITLVAQDDPELQTYLNAQKRGIMTVNVVPAVGCECMALMAFERLEDWLKIYEYAPRVRVVKLEVSEHDSNSAYVRLKQGVDEGEILRIVQDALSQKLITI